MGGEAKARVGDVYVPGILRALLLFLSRRRHCSVLVVAVVLVVVVWWWWVVSAACTRGGEADDAWAEAAEGDDGMLGNRMPKSQPNQSLSTNQCTQ